MRGSGRVRAASSFVVKLIVVCAACLVMRGEPAADVLGRGTETTTHNWAGVLAKSGTADGIDTLFGAVIAPRLRCRSVKSIVSVWIGFGGASGSMPQIGFHGKCEGGRASYTGFYEWFDPSHQHNTSTLLPLSRLKIAEGDLVSMTVTAGGRATDTWRGSILTGPSAGVSTGIGFAIPREPGAASKVGRTAECIVERPGSVEVGLPYQLANFGTIHWTSCRVEKAGSVTGAPSQTQRASARVRGGAWHQQGSRGYDHLTSFGVDRYSMREGSDVLASAQSSALTTDARHDQSVRTLGGFDVAWHAPGLDPSWLLPAHRVIH